MNVQEFNLTKRFFEVLSDMKALDPKDSKKREKWESRLYEFSEGFAKQVISEFNELNSL